MAPSPVLVAESVELLIVTDCKHQYATDKGLVYQIQLTVQCDQIQFKNEEGGEFCNYSGTQDGALGLQCAEQNHCQGSHTSALD